MLPRDIIESRIVVNEKTHCWEYIKKLRKDGYAQIGINGKKILAHRLSYTVYIGEIPEGMCVLHKCDNRKCLNPKHLWLGTQADNVRDTIEKGRDYHPKMPGYIPWAAIKAAAKLHKGCKLSEDHKKKLSVAGMGNKNSLGKVPTIETRKKLSKALRGNTRL